MKNLKNLRKNKKGFTLVEVIVVLVILSILIAIAVPSVLKYVDEANNAKYEAQAHGAMIAAETSIVKDYSDNKTVDDFDDLADNVSKDIGITVESIVPYKSETINENNKYTKTDDPNTIKAYVITIDTTVVTIVKNGTVTVTKAS